VVEGMGRARHCYRAARPTPVVRVTGFRRPGAGGRRPGALALVPGLNFSPNSVKTDQIQLNLNFKLVQTLTDQKLDLLELLKFEINYGFEDIEMMNIFLHRNFSRFRMDFKQKFREVSRFRIQ
jgi:hypothetical protein